MDLGIAGKWALVCGASKGLGFGCAQALSREGVPVLGINYKDKPEDALAFLARRGDPYTRLGRDEPGRVAIDWGLYGVPETYLVDRQGIIRWRYAGPLTPEVVDDQLRPLLRAMV